MDANGALSRAFDASLNALRVSGAGLPLSGGTLTGELSVPDLLVQGLTGATSDVRLVGGTASGPPATGTFAVLDVAIDATGVIWVCTVAGTPGTWVDASSSGKELAYASRTSDFTVTSSFNTWTLVTGCSISFTVGSRPVVVRCGGSYFFNVNAANNLILARLYDGSAELARVGGTTLPTAWSAFAGCQARFAANAGAKTIQLQSQSFSNLGNYTVSGATTSPIWIAAYEV